MKWDGRTVGVVNFHMIPTTSFAFEEVTQENVYREAQARALVELEGRLGPAILAGDANSVPLSGAYQVATAGLVDAWAQAGFGLGHTFPGSDIPGSSRPRVLGWSAPQWLARIDYIFFTPGWRALAARTARFDGVSDHRGVVAVLEFLDTGQPTGAAPAP
jgi:endonuclease/exonuclease/phosphatase (EEP) superfamily protein YafD